jgi:CRISPR-associated protein Cas2
MSMTVVVTRNAPARVRGFLASTMLELSAGVYSAPHISPAVRDRVWSVLENWLTGAADVSAVMVWRDRDQPSGQAVRTVGMPPIGMVDVDGLILARRDSAGATDPHG